MMIITLMINMSYMVLPRGTICNNKLTINNNIDSTNDIDSDDNNNENNNKLNGAS